MTYDLYQSTDKYMDGYNMKKSLEKHQRNLDCGQNYRLNLFNQGFVDRCLLNNPCHPHKEVLTPTEEEYCKTEKCKWCIFYKIGYNMSRGDNWWKGYHDRENSKPPNPPDGHQYTNNSSDSDD